MKTDRILEELESTHLPGSGEQIASDSRLFGFGCRRSAWELRTCLKPYENIGAKNLILSPWSLSLANQFISAFIALTVLMLFSPVMLVIAILIRMDSPGPVFFRQNRTGYLGRRFKVYKFRTMYADAESKKLQLMHLNHHAKDSIDFKIKNDPRVSRIGKYLRKYSLDEIPNLFNVVSGDMRIVGPRPTSFAATHYKEEHLVRLSVFPGVTGLWQVSGRSDLDFDQRVQLDVEYIKKQSLLQDLMIVFKTPIAVLKSTGAYVAIFCLFMSRFSV